jgi:predicted nucleic-acid-binding protein
MLYLLDTNIILAYFRKDKTYQYVEQNFQPFDNENFAVISVVSLGEINSIALRNQ